MIKYSNIYNPTTILGLYIDSEHAEAKEQLLTLINLLFENKCQFVYTEDASKRKKANERKYYFDNKEITLRHFPTANIIAILLEKSKVWSGKTIFEARISMNDFDNESYNKLLLLYQSAKLISPTKPKRLNRVGEMNTALKNLKSHLLSIN